MLFVVAGSLYGLSAPFAGNYVQLFFHPLSVEFIAGCYAALLVTSGRRLWPWLITAAGVAIMIAGLILQGDETAFTLGWGRVLWFGIPSFLIVYGFASLEAEDRLKPPQWLVTLGDWSFAIYLAHTFVLTGLRRVFESLAVRLAGTPYADWFTIGAPGRMDNILYYVLGVTLSLILSGMVFYLFERPVMKVTGGWRRSIFKHTNAQLKPGPIKPAIW